MAEPAGQDTQEKHDACAITAMFNGRELLEPGVVRISRWHPTDGRLEHNANRVWGFAGVARI
jgi:hypothetical protein